MTSAEWIKLRLPNGTSFRRNGLSFSVDEMIKSALADYSTKAANAQKRYALADLLEIILSDVLANDEQEGDYQSGDKADNLRNRINQWREEAKAIEDGATEPHSPGTMQFIPIVQEYDATDEHATT